MELPRRSFVLVRTAAPLARTVGGRWCSPPVPQRCPGQTLGLSIEAALPAKSTGLSSRNPGVGAGPMIGASNLDPVKDLERLASKRSPLVQASRGPGSSCVRAISQRRKVLRLDPPAQLDDALRPDRSIRSAKPCSAAVHNRFRPGHAQGVLEQYHQQEGPDPSAPEGFCGPAAPVSGAGLGCCPSCTASTMAPAWPMTWPGQDEPAAAFPAATSSPSRKLSDAVLLVAPTSGAHQTGSVRPRFTPD